MRQFADGYSSLLIAPLATAQLQKLIGQSSTVQLKKSLFGQSATAQTGKNTITPLTTAQLGKPVKKQKSPLTTGQIQKPGALSDLGQESLSYFFSITFTHHILLLDKCKDIRERFFYMQLAATQMLSVESLEYHIQAKTFTGNDYGSFKRSKGKFYV